MKGRKHMATYRLTTVGLVAALSSSPALALGGVNSASLNGIAAPTLLGQSPMLAGREQAIWRTT